jgi:hypothetical protein
MKPWVRHIDLYSFVSRLTLVHAHLDAFGVADECGSRASLERGSGFGLEALLAL